MKIPLSQFEQSIDAIILNRGLIYFNRGAVIDLERTSNDDYKATVIGSKAYTVELKIKNQIIVEHNCNCPYDMGPVCKHVVAVIFYLQKDKLEPELLKTPKLRGKRIPSVSQEINELLKVISHQELITFVLESSKKDKKFRTYFLTSFGHLSRNKSKDLYQRQIHSILQSAAGREGWIGWSDMKYVVNSTQPFLENAKNHLANKDMRMCFI